MSNFTRLLLFAAAWLMLLLAACAAPASTATATLTLTPEPTLTFTPAPTATGTPAPTATPEPSPTPELLLPPDFTVANWKEFRTKILPFCYVRQDLSSDFEGLTKLKNEVMGLEFYMQLKEKLNRGEIANLGRAVAPADGGGVCAVIGVYAKDVNTETSAFFQSRLDPNEWIEIKFTDSQ